MIKVGFDVDGTITAEPAIYAEIMRSLTLAGNECHVITGQASQTIGPEDYNRRIDQLSTYGILEGTHYKTVQIAYADYVTMKRDICKHFEIDFMFEDSKIYCDSISRVTRCVLMQDRSTS